MHPIVFGLPAFLAVLPLAVVAGCWPPWRELRRRGIPFARLTPFLIGALAVGLIGGKLYSIVERGEVGSLGWEIGTGFRYPGAVIALVAALPLLRLLLPAGVSFAAGLDMIAPGVGVAMALMRFHCLLSGCCSGSVCHLPWCISFPRASPPFQHQMIGGLIPPSAPQSLPVHPLQFYFMAASLGASAVAMWFQRRASYAGQTFLIFLAVHEGAKFSLEFFRSPAAPLVQTGDLIIGLTAAACLAGARVRSPRGTATAMPR